MTNIEPCTMLLSEYLVQFHRYDARLPNGGKITSHHQRDVSTEKWFSRMNDRQYLISYVLPNGDYRRCEISHDVIVACTETK